MALAGIEHVTTCGGEQGGIAALVWELLTGRRVEFDDGCATGSGRSPPARWRAAFAAYGAWA